MRLISCNIENFGLLSNREFRFDNGINTILRENGQGKSTLAAFLRIMLFGFSGDSKRDELENERKRYKPWQGGVFGGRLRFEAKGIEYEVTRTFGNKISEDTFELRNAATNIISNDYSERLGEELFLLDADSFGRTVFISQEQHETGVTAGIGAKLTNLAENTDDINNSEAAAKRITELVNRLSPTRKTGEIYKLKEEIAELEQKIKNRELVEESAESIGREIAAGEKEKEALENRREEARKMRAEASVRVSAGHYLTLSREAQNREKALKEAENRFPGRIPTEREVSGIKYRYGELNKINASLGVLSAEAEADRQKIEDKKAELNREEQRKKEYEELEKRNRDDFEKRRSSWLKKNRAQVLKIRVLSASIAAVLVIAGLIMLFVNPLLLIPFAVAGIAVLCAGFALSGRKAKEKFAEAAMVSAGFDFEYADKIQREISGIREKTDARNREIERLTEESEEIKAETEGFISECSFSGASDENKYGLEATADRLGRDVDGTLSEIERALADIANCRKEYEHARAALLDYERRENTDAVRKAAEKLSSMTGEDVREDDRSPEDFDREISAVEEKLENIRRIKTALEKQLEEKQDYLEMLTESENLLEEKQAQKAEKQRKFKALQHAGELLSAAKESFTAAYTAPLRKAFEKYYGIFSNSEKSDEAMVKIRTGAKEGFEIEAEAETVAGTGTGVGAGTVAEAEKAVEAEPGMGAGVSPVMFDANLKLSVLEQGLQREPKFFSAGRKDLLGLCMRMALIDAMYADEKPFIIMDDPFTNLDDRHISGGREFLKKAAESYQIIYLTCSKDRAKIL